MNSIDMMVNEHKNISRMLEVIRNASFQILKGAEINYDDFAKMIDFVRSYADAHHHGKEEKLLFTRMVEELGPAAQKLVTYGMLVEHDQGRLFMQELEEALEKVKNGDEKAKIDVIANAVSYTNLLYRHINKEDTLVYPFAEDRFKEETLNRIHSDCAEFEEIATRMGVQEKYLALLNKLEIKYQ